VPSVIAAIHHAYSYSTRQKLFHTTSNDLARIIVFCETKKGVDDLVKSLVSDGVRGVKAIHGDKCQLERDNVLQSFKDGKTCNVLVATDVASRGLDVKDIQLVINYDMPF
jgi:superfamily II DNA/RNA helicase